MPTKDPPIRGEGPAKKAALEAWRRGKAKAGEASKGVGAKAPAPGTLAKLRARVKELEGDKRLLREALDRVERQLRGKGIKNDG